MAHSARRGRIPPGEMFPAGDPDYRVSFKKLRSGIRVRVIERGSAVSPPVLFLPGWGSTVYIWRRNLPAIADAGFHAFAVDLKGSGLSDKPLGEHEYTSDALVNHVAEIIDALGLKKPVLVGHSQSALIAYRFAKRNPLRLRGLVLLSPVGHSGIKLLWLYKLLTPKMIRGILPSLCTRLAIRITLRRVYGKLRTFSDRDVSEFHSPCYFPNFSIAQRDSLHAFDWKQPVEGRLDLPALVIHGTDDHLVRGETLTDFEDAIPDIEAVVIEGAGHIVPEEADEQVNAALIRFLRRIGPA
ncbi:MAG: alpha/beta hydrolase [Gemmatimonadota bacterium]|nr:alpha/beta hydrolase [Gemmatimonadota bacterium]